MSTNALSKFIKKNNFYLFTEFLEDLPRLEIITCLAPFAVGCNSGPPPRVSTCSRNQDCHELEECRKDHEGISDCKCLRKYYQNKTTKKCELIFRWVQNDISELLNDKRLIRIDNNNRHYIITRLIQNSDDKVPYEGFINDTTKTVEPAFIEAKLSYDRMEFLLAEPGYYQWMKSSNGRIEKNAIEGGQINDDTIYICRVRWQNYFLGVKDAAN
ncbi:hypothetical protein PV327_001508 [Microctonus hyperodae]|uniref:Uncharacterized protein n=1 Tax=Microctonus hyperodae TaxID=165561 RepID=A0AA39G9E1_MICHY|nr:hypothetical protein PV327_001508 [Microctonus hyperodae]